MFRRGESDSEKEHGHGPIEPKEVRVKDGQGAEVTIVGPGARLEGTLMSAGSLRIDGQVRGSINAEGDVLLSPQGDVEADVSARNVTVAGRIKGNIVVKTKAEIARGGRVEGDITSKTLVVAEGASFLGRSIMDPPASPATAAPQGRSQERATVEESADAGQKLVVPDRGQEIAQRR